MNYKDLIQLYFERSNALQWYWTLYVIIIGGLLAFSSLRKQPDLRTVILVSVLYGLFAYKNLGAIEDVTLERSAILETVKILPLFPQETGEIKLRQTLEPTLMPTSYEGVRNFHIVCDLLTLAAIWAMEWRRIRMSRTTASLGSRAAELNTPEAPASLRGG